MKLIRSALPSALRVLTLVLACSALPGHADEYADVTQLLRLNKPNDALAMADRFLASKPQDAQMRFLKGVIQRTLGKQAEAIATFTKLTEDYPELPEPYNNLAVLYAGQGQYDKARVALEMAIRTNPSYATAHENIGDVYSRLASQAYNKALQLDGSNPAVPPKLALIREIFKPNLPGAAPVSPASIAAAAAASANAAAAKPVVVAAAPVSKPTPAVAEPAKPAVTVAAAPPVVAPVASPAPAPAKPEVRPTADAVKLEGVETAVQAWAQAWADKNMQAYLAAYVPQFAPAGQSHGAWAKERTARIVGKSSISVELSDLSVSVDGDKAVAKFRQAYKADSLNVNSRKVLELQQTGGRWLITKEVSGN
jgi:tetratricopeptide (TPR) repeat protein